MATMYTDADRLHTSAEAELVNFERINSFVPSRWQLASETVIAGSKSAVRIGLTIFRNIYTLFNEWTRDSYEAWVKRGKLDHF